jgi:hypothetical protein
MPSIMFNRGAWQRSFVPLSSNVNAAVDMDHGDASSATGAATEVASPSLVNLYTIQKLGNSFEWERRPSLGIELIIFVIALSFVIYTLC